MNQLSGLPKLERHRGGLEGSPTVVICHKVPEIKVMVHFSYTQLFVILWTTGRSDLCKKKTQGKTVTIVDRKRKHAVSKKR